MTLANSTWINAHPNTKVSLVPISLLRDHCPILVSTDVSKLQDRYPLRCSLTVLSF